MQNLRCIKNRNKVNNFCILTFDQINAFLEDGCMYLQGEVIFVLRKLLLAFVSDGFTQ